MAISAPTDIAGCQLWLDAQSLGLADGAAVSSWPDLSGKGRHAAQSDTTRQPTFRGSAPVLNGHPAVVFTGDRMGGPLSIGTSGWSLFFAGAIDTWTQNAGFISASNATDNDHDTVNGFALEHERVNELRLTMGYPSALADEILMGVPISSTCQVFAVTVNNTTARSWANPTTNNHGDIKSASTMSPTQYALAARIYSGALNGGSNITLGEVIFYNRDVTDAERADVFAYLERWCEVPPPTVGYVGPGLMA